MIGQRFTRLVIINSVKSDGYYHRKWLCQCDCGNTKIVLSTNLLSGKTKSCGCLRKEIAREQTIARSTKHGYASGKKSATYNTWDMMKERCGNPKATSYARYGGKGITVCERWHSFDSFLADMGERPDGTTLDRYPNKDGNYEPDNCRWATPREQANNRNKRKVV